MELPVKIAEDIYLIKSDNPFVNNTYLIKSDESVLIDPHYDEKLQEKLKKIVDLNKIKYVIFQDVSVDTVKSIEKLNTFLKDFKILVHWKNFPFLNKKFNNIVSIDEDFEFKNLKFILTPFNTGIGSFCILYKNAIFTNALLSSIKNSKKIFGENNKKYLTALNIFHNLYFPKKYLFKNLNKIPENCELYLPKYGFILDNELFLEAKKELKHQNIKDLQSEIVLSFYENVINENFNLALRNLFMELKKIIPTLEGIEFHIEDKIFTFGNNKENRYEIKEGDLKTILYLKGNLIITDEFKEFIRFLLKAIYKSYKTFKEKEKSIIDPLTGLFNREYLKFLKPKLKQSIRYNFNITFAKISIKFLEEISNLYKDCIIKEVAKILQSHFRSSDILIREGNEFLIVMPFTNYFSLQNKLNKIKVILENSEFCANKKFKISVDTQMVEYDKKSELEDILKAFSLKKSLLKT
jgi:diguanylate cyclase (GGDEF)-like protein